MSKTQSRKIQKAIVDEISQWRREDLISTELERVLLARYPSRDHRTDVSGAITMFGAILVGLGTLLFVGANWSQISVFVKLLLIFVSIGVSQYFGWKFQFEPGNRPKLGAALMVLGSLFFGAGIWLVAQIFNLDFSLGNGLLLWALGTATTSVVLRSVPLGCLTAVLIACWNFTDLNFWSYSVNYLERLHYTILVLLGSLGLAGFLRSRAVVWVTLLSATAWFSITGAHQYGLLLWGLGLFGCYLWTNENWKLFTSPFLYVSTGSSLLSLLISTCTSHQADMKDMIMPVLLFLCILTLGLVAWRTKAAREEIIVCAGIALIACLTVNMDGGIARAIDNTLLLGAIIGLAHTGLNRVQSAGLVNVAVVFFVLDVTARYFDFFFSMMDRSLFFVFGGIVLLAVGSIAEKGRRRMLQGLQTA
ncbi:MAG: DUF2157 domain-containing protein [Cyanobacteria bacterium]|nr:DUF2157 domain-containing protein [Cyanobacteriota bacterium]